MNAGDETMNVLPYADKAIIPEQKIKNYSLDFDREPNKAAAFKNALGYDLSNADDLIDNIRRNVKNFRAVQKPDNDYGKRYEVLMTLTGANGKTANVKTAWIIDNGTEKPRLISAYITKKRVKED
jgi:hypothetical protein